MARRQRYSRAGAAARCMTLAERAAALHSRMMINVELQIAERSEPWHRIKVAVAPRAGDFISLNISEGKERIGRIVRVDRVLLVADEEQGDGQDVVVLQATLLTPEDADSLRFR